MQLYKLILIFVLFLHSLLFSEGLKETLTEGRHLGWDTYPTLPSEVIKEHFIKVQDPITKCYEDVVF